MGCDIHFRVERRDKSGRWETVQPGLYPHPWREGEKVQDWPTPRQYLFFARLADVRNYDESDYVEPVAPRRGLPEDMASKPFADEEFGDRYEDADAVGLSWLGDHSFSWATLRELQEGFAGEWRERICEEYVRLIFEDWPKLGDPDNVRVIFGFDS